MHFLGKDSILFERENEVAEAAYRNLEEFITDGDRVFSGKKTEQVREFLSEAMPRISPKVFRTFSATELYRKEMDSSKVTPESQDNEKKMALMEANAAVAQLLNHRRQFRRNGRNLQKRVEMLQSLKGKKGKSVDKRKQSLKLRLTQMKLNKTWNLGTSLKNYIDPRVSVRFIKVNYDWKKYYPKTLVSKFAWAEPKSE